MIPVDVTTLIRATSEITAAVSQFGLLEAIKAHRIALTQNGETDDTLTELTAASTAYIQATDAFDSLQQRIASLLHIDDLKSADYWDEILSTTDKQQQLGTLMSCYSRLLFCCNHLPHLVALLEEASTEDDASEAAEAIQFRLLPNNGGKTSFARTATVISSYAEIYRSLASMQAMTTGAELELRTIDGRGVQFVTFSGDEHLIELSKDLVRTVLATGQENPLTQSLIEEHVDGVLLRDEIAASAKLVKENPDKLERVRESLITQLARLTAVGIQISSDTTARIPTLTSHHSDAAFNQANESGYRAPGNPHAMPVAQSLANNDNRTATDQKILFSDAEIEQLMNEYVPTRETGPEAK